MVIGTPNRGECDSPHFGVFAFSQVGSTHNHMKKLYFIYVILSHNIMAVIYKCLHVIEVNQVTLYILYHLYILKELHL